VLANAIIALLSAALLLYWFRYSCMLIVRSRKKDGRVAEVAQANQLSFPAVRSRVATAEPASLEDLYRLLEKDRQMLLFLLDHTAGPVPSSIERRLLALDFVFMRCWYRLVQPFSSSHARSAVREMTEILTWFADAMGRRVAVSVQ
jgi:hypothetical protein